MSTKEFPVQWSRVYIMVSFLTAHASCIGEMEVSLVILMSHQCDTFVSLCFIQYSITLECIQMNLNCTANTTYQILIFDISWINPTMTWIWDLNFKSDISSIITIHINDPHTKVEMSLDYQIRPQHWTVCLSCNSVISQERINIIPSCHCWAHTTESNQFQSF